MKPADQTPSNPPDIPWEVIVKFIRQLTHDLRNHLNAAELQAAFLGEIASDKEVKDEVKRLREMLGTTGSALQKLSADLGHPRTNPMSYRAADFMEDLRQKLSSATSKDSSKIEWNIDVGDLALDLDPQLLSSAMQELIGNARRFGDSAPITVSASADAGRLVLSLSEPKIDFAHDLSQWAREPFKNISHGHYGLGLNRARIIVESHGGKLDASYDSKAKNLVTRITLPESQATD
jgi:light-regulated signal transduction histidine kinase (bacteriophytochrome)